MQNSSNQHIRSLVQTVLHLHWIHGELHPPPSIIDISRDASEPKNYHRYIIAINRASRRGSCQKQWILPFCAIRLSSGRQNESQTFIEWAPNHWAKIWRVRDVNYLTMLSNGQSQCIQLLGLLLRDEWHASYLFAIGHCNTFRCSDRERSRQSSERDGLAESAGARDTGKWRKEGPRWRRQSSCSNFD